MTRDYVDRKRRNVTVALLQILQPHMTTYMTSWQKAALKLRDEMVINARREIDELRAKVQTDFSAEQVQSRTLADELVRKTQALEQSEAARRADEELLGRLQSQCDELRTQRAAAELQLARLKATTGARQIARGRN
ncbi:hypothetical protein AXG93_4413s1200 [Marchantia polymorpha subsp. ruderalis]|uniref:Uncharacterized protein n=1 Tax=Marchantia polymorpha subsp. ruderalis TaxID=1480154 RepID=A0A176W436_MARPO|nr:hypothetical protein AXG93_4413s1200 [Marchantia polymorpha subsp. ruderalis]